MKKPESQMIESPAVRHVCAAVMAAGCALAIATMILTRATPAPRVVAEKPEAADGVSAVAVLKTSPQAVETVEPRRVAAVEETSARPDTGDVTRLVASGDMAALRLLAEALKAAHSPEDIRILLALCADPSTADTVRQVAFELLGFLGDPAAAAGLMELSSDSTRPDTIRGLALWTLGQVGEQQPSLRSSIRDLAVSFLSASSPDLRRNAVNTLGLMRTGDASPDLLGLLHDLSPAVRARAAWALSRADDVSVSGPLIEATRGERDCYEFVQALSDIKAPSALPVLFEKARDASEEDGFREFALAAIGRIGDRDAVPGLVEILDGDNEFLAWGAARALAAIGDPSAVPALEHAARARSWKSAFVGREIEEIYAQCTKVR
jgi:HEAT repeat protein